MNTRARLLFAASLILLVGSTTFLSIAAYQNPTTINSQGTIVYGSKLTVILKGLTLTDVNPNQDLTKYVKNYVGNYTFAENMIVILGDLHICGILWYGQNFTSSSGKWMGWTFNQLKTLIDQFHAYGWKVWWGGTAIAWNNQWEYNYIKNYHPELAFCDANGYRANDATPSNPNGNTPGNKLVGYNSLIPNFWAKYSTSDNNLNIAAGTRLIDVIATRLGQMIADGLQFDGWMPSDGWNGFNIWSYNFPSTTKATAYSFSYQDTDDWKNDTTSGYGLTSIGQPSSWASWNITQKANWIITNSTAYNCWHNWWCYRFSKMYLQIKNAIKNNNPTPQDFYVMIGADGSCQWESGNLGGGGLLNFTMVANDGSIDRFYVDPEISRSEQPKEEAYVAGLVRSKNLNCVPLIGIQVTSWYDSQTASPLWQLKQQYLAQVQNYIWFDGVRYPACNTTDFCLQYPPANPAGNIYWATSQWNNTAVHQLFDWIHSLSNVFAEIDEPLYLGPVYTLPYIIDGGEGAQHNAVNYTFAQWVDTRWLANNPECINAEMGTIFIDSHSMVLYPLTGCEDTILNLFSSGNLNIIWLACCDGKPFSQVFNSGTSGETSAETAFHITQNTGTQNSYTILYPSNIASAVGKWIIGTSGGTFIQLPLSSYKGRYQAANGFVPLANYTDNRIALGIYNDDTTARFLYAQNWAGDSQTTPQYKIYIPREVINKAIYWASYCPINSSNSLIDLKVFKLDDGTIVIPMMNHYNTSYKTANGAPLYSTLNLDASILGLGNPNEYNVYWQSNRGTVTVSQWSTIPITLNGMADVLVIAPK